MKVKIVESRRFPSGHKLCLLFFQGEAAGSLTLWPHELINLTNALVAAGHEVVLCGQNKKDESQ